MFVSKLAVALILCALLTGCKDVINPDVPYVPPSATGNWAIYNVTFALGQTVGGIGDIGGAINQTDNTLSGTFYINNSCFGSGQTPIPLTGSITGDNNFSLTSPPVNGETFTLTGVFSSSHTTFNQGYIGISGACTGTLISQTGDQKGAIANPVGTQIPNLTSNWAFYPAFTLQTLNLSEQLTQSPTSDAQGRFALTGTASIVGSPCFTSGTLQPGSYVSGSDGEQIILLNDGSTLTSPLLISYKITPGRPNAIELYPGNIAGGNCNGPVNIDLQ